MIDVNLFKHVNDRYGHQIGDEALKTVATVLNSSCRSTDFCARLGGDEFAVVLPHADAAAAAVVRDRILQSLPTTPVPVDGGRLTLSLSIGIASLPDDATASEGLIAAADSAMYRVKQASRSQQSWVT
jgi:diguanylate cyclase (GGDEF)-like protein